MVYGKDMVNTAVHERAVVRHKYKSFLAVEISAEQLSSVHMICRLINEQKAVLPQEHCRKLQLCLLSE